MKTILLVTLFVILLAQSPAPKKEDCPPEITQYSNSVQATLLWQDISQGMVDSVVKLIDSTPCLIHVRAEDGRGPLWWAYEFKQMQIVKYLMDHGADDMLRDNNGASPRDLMPKNDGLNVNFKPGPDINQLPKHLRDQKDKLNNEEEELKRLAKERAEKLKKMSSTSDEL